ncbi:MFS transporter [Streptomyces boluensis]|uniref:MFS transporter n=1 Tax=Streptomyces boluensis TaxID=1775135 RepID=UPI0028AB7213|nr:MFS transporter [Streptomyces boluensis]
MLGVGVLVRPLGGILLGRLADRRGRKPALVLAIALMTGGSVLVGVTPTYEQIGLAAPFVLLLARVAQGISSGVNGPPPAPTCWRWPPSTASACTAASSRSPPRAARSPRPCSAGC